MVVDIVERMGIGQMLTAVGNEALAARSEEEETAETWMGTTDRNFAPCREVPMVLLVCNDYSQQEKGLQVPLSQSIQGHRSCFRQSICLPHGVRLSF